MHGGYRGSGVTINWNTATPNIESQQEPTPIQPPPLPNIPIKPIPPHSLVSVTSKSKPNIAGIVGLTLGGVAALTAIGIGADVYLKNRSGIVDEENRPFIKMRGSPEEEKYILDQEASDPELFLSRRPDQSELERREAIIDFGVLRGGDPLYDPEQVEFHYH